MGRTVVNRVTDPSETNHQDTLWHTTPYTSTPLPTLRLSCIYRNTTRMTCIKKLNAPLTIDVPHVQIKLTTPVKHVRLHTGKEHHKAHTGPDPSLIRSNNRPPQLGNTPEGDVTELSQDYTLLEEGVKLRATYNSAQQSLADLEILPEITQTEDNGDTPEEKAAEISLDYILTEEGKGDNISGNKEKRNDGDTKDETNMKRPKVPLQPLKPTE